MVMILEGDVEELEICSGRAKDYEPLVYVGYLLAGGVAGIASALWLAHIVIYMLVPDPPTTFLNAFLNQFSHWSRSGVSRPPEKETPFQKPGTRSSGRSRARSSRSTSCSRR